MNKGLLSFTQVHEKTVITLAGPYPYEYGNRLLPVFSGFLRKRPSPTPEHASHAKIFPVAGKAVSQCEARQAGPSKGHYKKGKAFHGMVITKEIDSPSSQEYGYGRGEKAGCSGQR